MQEQKPATKKLNLTLIFLLLLFLGLVGWFVYLKQTGSSPITSLDSSDKVLMIVKYVGGLCPNGRTCSTEYKLFEDGTFEGHSKVNQEDLRRLNEALDKSDLRTYKPKADAACPSFADGQDEVLVFPERYHTKTFTVCMLEIPSDDVVIKTVHSLIESHRL